MTRRAFLVPSRLVLWTHCSGMSLLRVCAPVSIEEQSTCSKVLCTSCDCGALCVRRPPRRRHLHGRERPGASWGRPAAACPMNLAGEDDDGVRGGIAQARSDQCCANGCDCGSLRLRQSWSGYVRELGLYGSAGGCTCTFRMASIEVGVVSFRADWTSGSVVALTPEGSSGAAWGGGCGGVLAGGSDGRRRRRRQVGLLPLVPESAGSVARFELPDRRRER